MATKKKKVEVEQVVEVHPVVEQPKSIEVKTVTQVKEQPVQNEPKYPKELIVKSNAIKEFHLHQDVIRAILTDREYTLSDAKTKIQRYIDSF